MRKKHGNVKGIEIVHLNEEVSCQEEVIDFVMQNTMDKIKSTYEVPTLRKMDKAFNTHNFPPTISRLSGQYANIVNCFFTNPMGKNKKNDNTSLRLCKLWTARHVKMVITYNINLLLVCYNF